MTYTLIRNGTLIDGNGGAPLRDAAVLLEGNRIRAVGAARSVAVPADATIIDAQGGAILPGLIDTHVHLMVENIVVVMKDGKVVKDVRKI